MALAAARVLTPRQIVQAAPRTLDFNFGRNSLAYTSDGKVIPLNVPRFEPGKFGQAVMVEEGTTQLVQNSKGSGGSGSTPPARWELQDDPGVFSHNFSPDPAFPDHIADTLTVNNTSGSFKNGRIFFEQAIPVSAGETVTVALYGELISGTPQGSITLGFHKYDSNGAYLGEPSVGVTFTVTRRRFVYTYTVESGVAYVRPRLTYYSVPNGANFSIRFVAPQVEKKPYATSYMRSDNAGIVTRSPETLTIPTAGVLNPQEGTVECWVYVNDLIKDASRNRHIFDARATTVGLVALYHKADTGEFVIHTRDANNNNSIVGIADADVPNGWHKFTIRWSATEAAILLDDGTIKATVANPYLPPDFASTATLGSYSGTNFMNTLIDDLRISSRARTDEEIAAAYQSGQPLPIDQYTTKKLSFDAPQALAATRITYAMR